MAWHNADNQKGREDNPRKRPAFRWLSRIFFGAHRELRDLETEFRKEKDSPSRRVLYAFGKKKSGVAALAILILLFLTVFLLPPFLPLDVNFSDAMLAGLPPTVSLRRMPRALQKSIRAVDATAGFSVGVDGNGKLYLWGVTKDPLTGIDLSKIPGEVKGGVLAASAGADFVFAVTSDGKVIGWGNDERGQLGNGREGATLVAMPETLRREGIEPDTFSSLDCGYQATALVADGKLYLWGNAKALGNMNEALSEEYTNLKKAVMTHSSLLLLNEEGKVILPGEGLRGEAATSSFGVTVDDLETYLADKRVVDIAAGAKCFAILTEEGELLVQGPDLYGEHEIPKGTHDGRFTAIAAGMRHFAALTEEGSACAWGYGVRYADKIGKQECDAVFCGSEQTYLASKEGALLKSYGRIGYLFGTDNLGRDIFLRILHGGRMTMTVGGVAVLISSAIAILVGCTAGFFGGWVDTLLMRVTEVFASIPFLPFAMMLSFILRTRPVGELGRIVLIMVILGLLSWTGLARVIRSQVLSEREKEYITASRGMGVREGIIAFRHILPNVISVILVSMTLSFASCLLTESSLSYLGFGVQQPQPTWGNMLSGAGNSVIIRHYWWQWLFPALFLSLATVAINVLGDAFRDALDPKSRRN